MVGCPRTLGGSTLAALALALPAFGTAAGLLLFARPAQAQETEGPIAPEGRLRIGAAPSIWSVDGRYGRRVENGSVVEGVEPLGFDLDYDALPASVFPGLSALESDLRSAADDPSLPLTLGRTRVDVRQTSIRIPLQVDLGVTEWLTVGATVPVVRQRSEVEVLFSADSLSADLGASPAQTSPTTTATFLDAVAAANAALQDQVDTYCGADPGSADCQGAQAALVQGETYLSGIASAYESGLFPFGASDAGAALRNRLDALQAAYASYGVGDMPAGSELPLASVGLTSTDLQLLLSQPIAGIGVDPLGTRLGAWSLGDVELYGAVRLVEWAPAPAGEGATGGPTTGAAGGAGGGGAARPGFLDPHVLLGVGATLRLGTGTPGDPDVLFDLGSGDGQTDVELRAFTDLQFGGDLGLWVDVRRGIQMEGERVRRVAPPERVLAPLASRTAVRWDPGDYWAVDAAPRWRLTPELAVAGRYRFWRKGRDAYALVDADAGGGTLDAAELERETSETRHEAGVSLVYSTLAASRTTGTRPMEVRFRYLAPVAGSGGRTPRGHRVEGGLRLFWSLWGD